ncbi:MAG: hypothetical protein ACFB0D_24145 [Phormidesmis sp.]
MSLVALLLVIFIALIASNLMDALPGVLWGWIHWPQWASWVLLVVILAWCLEQQSTD